MLRLGVKCYVFTESLKTTSIDCQIVYVVCFVFLHIFVKLLTHMYQTYAM